MWLALYTKYALRTLYFLTLLCYFLFPPRKKEGVRKKGKSLSKVEMQEIMKGRESVTGIETKIETGIEKKIETRISTEIGNMTEIEKKIGTEKRSLTEMGKKSGNGIKIVIGNLKQETSLEKAGRREARRRRNLRRYVKFTFLY